MQGILQVHVRKLVASVVLSQFESIVEFFLVSFEINGSFYKSILNQKLCAAFGAHSLSNFNSYFSKFLFRAISLSYTKSFFPEIVSPVHVDRVRPRATLNIVVLSLLQVSLHLEGLRQMVMSVLK